MPETRQPRTWKEIGRDLVRPSRTQLIVGVILLLFGFALSTQLGGMRDQRYTNLRQDELVSMLDDVTAESRRLEAEVTQLERTRDQLQSGVDANQVAREEARKRLESLELLGGTVPARGPGVRIAINDPQGRITTEIMLNTIEELRDAGAEVIEVDDKVRLVANSWVAKENGALVLDGAPLGRNFTIEAIGDARTLAEATRFRGGLVSTIEGERVRGTVQVTELPTVEIRSTVPVRELGFARPA